MGPHDLPKGILQFPAGVPILSGKGNSAAIPIEQAPLPLLIAAVAGKLGEENNLVRAGINHLVIGGGLEAQFRALLHSHGVKDIIPTGGPPPEPEGDQES